LFREQGRNAEAEQALRAALKTDESNPAVVIELARLLFEQQNSEAAKLLLLSLQSPGSSIAPFKEAAVLLGKIEVTLGNTADGEKLILQSVELPSIQIAVDDVFHRELAAGRRDPLWMGQLAVMKARGGDDVAVMRLRDLVARYPELVANRIHLAMLMMDEGKLGQAKDLLQGGLESGSDDSRLLMGLAAVCIEQKDWKAAEGHLRSLLLVDAANVSGNSDLAFVLEQQGRHNEAAAAYRQTLDLSPTSRQVRERLEVLEKTTR
jgi:Flp pilus assembly protein TadD